MLTAPNSSSILVGSHEARNFTGEAVPVPPNLLGYDDTGGGSRCIMLTTHEFQEINVSLLCATVESASSNVPAGAPSTTPKFPLFVQLSGNNHRRLNPKYDKYAQLLELECYHTKSNLFGEVNALFNNDDGEYTLHIVGQPGIGKTSFLIYTFLRYIQQNKPVLIMLESESKMIGVCFQPAKGTREGDSPETGFLSDFSFKESAYKSLHEETLILLDSGRKLMPHEAWSLPEGFQWAQEKRVVFAALPAPNRSAWMEKCAERRNNYIFKVVPLPSERDIIAFGTLMQSSPYNKGQASLARVKEVASMVGPSLRMIHWKIHDTDLAIKRFLKTEARKLVDPKNASIYGKALQGELLDDVDDRKGFHRIFFVRPHPDPPTGRDDISALQVYLPTPYLREALAISLTSQYGQLLAGQAQEFAKTAMFAYAYENYAHYKLDCMSRQSYSEEDCWIKLEKPLEVDRRSPRCSTPVNTGYPDTMVRLPYARQIYYGVNQKKLEALQLDATTSYLIHLDQQFPGVDMIIFSSKYCVCFHIPKDNQKPQRSFEGIEAIYKLPTAAGKRLFFVIISDTVEKAMSHAKAHKVKLAGLAKDVAVGWMSLSLDCMQETDPSPYDDAVSKPILINME